MAYYGEKARNKAFRIIFDFVSAPTGTPTIEIFKGATEVLASDIMTVVAGTSNKIWSYDYTTDAAAAVGFHQIRCTAVIAAVTEYVHHYYDQIIAAAGDGAYNAIINVKDDTPANVAGAIVTIHNAADDDDPLLASGTTDASGNVTLLISGNVMIRPKKAGYNFTSTAKNVNASGTYNVTGTALVITPPANPDVSKCYISVYDLSGTVVTSGVTLTISKHDDLAKDSNSNFATDTGVVMTYDAGSETWQADIIKGMHVNVKSTKVLGVDDNGDLIDRDFTVGTGSTTDLGSIKLS